MHTCVLMAVLGASLVALVRAASPETRPAAQVARFSGEAATQPSTQPAADAPGGAVAFASLAPRGWDLYRTDLQTGQTARLTAHPALDYNAAFSGDGRQIAFVSQRDGNMEIYASGADGSQPRRLTDHHALDDHPAWSPDGKRIAFVSTREPADRPGRAWNAIYVMNADGSGVRRLSPRDAADYSPAWSPRGDLIAFASGSGQQGQSDLYVMAPDGTGRRLVVKDAGWPAFGADGRTIYFHSRREGGWGIWRVGADGQDLARVSPDGTPAFTPRTSPDGRWLVAAVLHDQRRQIVRIDPQTGKVADLVRDSTDLWNPAISSDARYIVYHRASPNFEPPNVETWAGPPGFLARLLRVAGSFPAFSADGRQIALVGPGFATIDRMNADGSARKTLYRGAERGLFSVSWAHNDGLLAFSEGTVFQGPAGKVDVVTMSADGGGRRVLTADAAGNNGFPSFSPDGRQIVFRSGREGDKNLYVMDRDGANARRLTRGDWTDTMADWSPTGEWIAFASDRGENFEIYLIRPDGTDLRKLIGGGGRNNHPHFSPDGQWIVFTSQRAGYSAEEISLPQQPQPYGDLFAVRLDGTGLTRLTHNDSEEGTPAWGR